ncbi:MAG: chromosome segregation protein [Chthoniobacter sp.]|jgi:chromosome segregation protein|nr:chromosome segregation protein [Chthoniobacter sp.]
MYLQSLELFGFKSFAPKTKMEFHRGVTAVVGPNGCGKSNVLDAMRWVLGEQSAKALRGGEMADVIFSGTDSRAAVGMAEVSMTFSECEEQLGLDWHEVTITRRVFRDGGSEYLLNKTPCRLKDIQQLFMDTGIGRSAYSIMEQGKIDMILSSRPEDRRAIFEEAAGITKYKAQKKEALRKLEATEANLLRLADIIKEVKRQIGSLQRQAGKARRYQSLISDLKLLETHAAKRQFDALEEHRTTTIAELARLADRQTECEQEIESQESQVSVQRAALDEMEQRLNQARQGVNDLKTRISNHENRIVFNTERADEFAGLAERYRSDVAGAEEKFRIAETQLRDTDSELEQITALLASELRVMEEKQAATAALTGQRQEAERTISSLANDATRVESRMSGLRGQIATVMQQRDGAEARLSILSGELDQLTFAFAQFTDRLRDTQAQIDQALIDLEARTGQLAESDIALRDAQGGLAGVDRELRDAQRALAEKESKLEVLRHLNEGGEGFSGGTQAVLRGLDNPEFFKPSVLGALAQFIEVAPEFVIAVEAALGTNLQAIVMKDSMVAESVIKTLTAQRLGKASLALRDCGLRIADCGLAEALPEGALGWLLDHVKAEDSVSPLVRTLLRDFILVPNIETAVRLAAANPQSAEEAEGSRGGWRTGEPIRNPQFVTLSGEVLTRDGILHGGATGEAVNSVLQRKNQIHALEAEEQQVQQQVDRVTERREQLLSEIETTQARLDQAREEKQDAALLVSTLRNQLAMCEREAKDAERKQQNLEGERLSSEARHREAADRAGGLETEIAASLELLEELQTRRGAAQNELEVLRAQESEVASELNELRIKVATERQRHSSLHHQRQPMEARLAELSELIAARQQDIVSYEQRAGAMLAENAEIEVNLERLRGQVGEGEAAVATLLEERSGMAAAVEELSNTLRILRHQLSETHDLRSRLEVKQTQVEMKLTALTEHIQKRYQIDLREFQRDLYGLRVAIRDYVKRQANGGAAGVPPAESGSGAAPVTADVSSEEPVGDAEERTHSAASASETPEPLPASDDAFAIDWDRIDAMVRDLDQRLDSMGPVNLDAIQEYDELEERHAFLEKQNTDLTNSKEELLGVITKINHTTRTLFADTFEKIRVNFQEMFIELFGGGKANLVLTDESDPLESGIDIIAKPPGKQLQSISLLSGGERTMTAVALLFSIYMVKPSPFCVLDEMDAPLDESNISRFIKILDRFVGQSQFIVISHHKRTIARADALYGVTMEEHGVSKLVGVKFSRREDSHEGRDIMGTNNPAPVPSVAETFGKSGSLHSEGVESAGGVA